jgi:ADP-dependent NAD(P)H-hydrate dehydratase / NAD(P)H-hydrate epimerase
MKVVTAAEMQEIDRITIAEMGMPGVTLMGLAGRAVAHHVLSVYPRARRAAVFCGTGNNGGDGFMAAYLLSNSGIRADIFLAGDEKKISETSRPYFTLCKNAGLSITPLDGSSDAPDLDGYDCILDALLGTGFAGTARGAAAEAISMINEAETPVVAVDVPSGLGSDGAAPEGEAVIADHTVTIGLPKISLVTYPGKDYAGRLHVADIGFPPSLTEGDSLACELIDGDYFRNNAISEIELGHGAVQDAHKGSRGNLLIIGGFDGMEGAALLTAGAAFETGTGLASLLTTDAARKAVAGIIPELITLSLPAGIDIQSPDPAAVRKTMETVLGDKTYRSVVIGPGMGRTPLAAMVFREAMSMIRKYGTGKALIDGDGLYHLAGFIEKGSLDPGVDWVVTPHFMEASRILGVTVEEIKNNRHHAARTLSRRLACAALLKGPASIVCGGNRSLINTTGSAALATAGSGDVLSGIIGALMLRRFSALQAAALGTWIHGKAADLLCAEEQTPDIKSSDLVRYIRKAKCALQRGTGEN